MKSVFTFIFIGVSALAAMCDTASAAIHIALYGDSLTSGYQLGPDDGYTAKLQKKLKDIGYQDVDVLNLSVPGETSAQGLDRISSVLVKHPDIVVVELGANDAIGGLSIGLINNNIGYMIGRLQQSNMEVVLFGVAAPPNMGQMYVGQLASVYSSLAEKYQVALVPNILDGVTGASLTQGDGFHPNAAGVDVMVENSFRAIDGALRSKWNQIQQQQYEKSQQGATPPPQIVGPTGLPPEAR
jgi:acyl-CoA thioesterase-1